MNNKLQRKFAICCLLLMFITPFTTSYAATVEECGQALSDYALNFANETNSPDSKLKTHYYVLDVDDSTPASQEKTERSYAWNNQQSPNCTHNNFGSDVTDLGMDCVGWVSYAIHNCYGLSSSEGKGRGGTAFTCFVYPVGANAPFDIINSPKTSDYKEGDILINSTHVMIYVGNGNMVDCANTNGGHPGVAVRKVPNDICALARISDSGASGITSLVKSVNGTGFSTGSSLNYSNFFFNGIPDGKYSIATKDTLLQRIAKKIVSTMIELYKYLSGMIVYLFRGFIIGIISIFDRLVNNTIQSIEDSPKSLEESGVGLTNADDPSKMDRSVTIEGLIFNELDLFDINIFKTE